MGKRWTQTEGQWPEVMKSAAHQYEDKLLEFAYGELPQHEADAVDAHVRGCTRCSQSLSEIRGVRATMSGLPMASAPDAGLESLMAYAEQAAKRSASKTAPSIWKRFLMPLASVMALAVVGVVGFRANQEFDTSPASALADGKLEEVSKAQAKEKEQRQELAAADQQTEAQAPPTVAAVAPPPVDLPKAEPQAAGELDRALKNAKQDAKEGKKVVGGLDDLREAGGKRGDVWSPEPKGNVPQSVTRRDAAAKTAPVANDEQVYRSQNYSDVGVRGSKLSKDASPPPPPAQAQDKVNYGLGSPGAAPNEPAPQGGSTGPAVAAKPSPAPMKAPAAARQEAEAKKESVQQGRAEERPAPAPVTVAPAPSAPSSNAAPSTRKSKSGYGILPPSNSSTGSSADLDDALSLPQSDTLGVNSDAKFAERKRAEQRTGSLESARVASNRGDRLSEIRLAAQVLESGATGYERVEALKRICDAYEFLGEPDRADPFCDLLLREFPNTAAAKAVSDRRKRVQRAPAPSPKSPAAADRERKALDEAQPAEQAPASSY